MAKNKLLKTSEVVELLSISKSTLKRYEHQGLIKPLFLNQQKRYSKKDLMKLLGFNKKSKLQNNFKGE